MSYRGEDYLVRDNGSVCRFSLPNRRKRPLDGVWTFGNQCRTNGYRRISGMVIHKIVATAFYGEPPSSAHVVDHLDTNRRNNRIDNLRWVTRLENITQNPRTLRRIRQKWESVEGMLRDPNRTLIAEPLCNRSWMPRIANFATEEKDTSSYTPMAVQRNWRTPNAFPLCPAEVSKNPLKDYFAELVEGSIFAHNKFGECEVEIAVISDDESFLSVMTRIPSQVKGWALAKITVESETFVHEAFGTFFTREGAEKCQSLLLGNQWQGGPTIDDFC